MTEAVDFAPYIAGLADRERRQRQVRRDRAAQALAAARRAAALLRRTYPVTRVRVFGSVLHPESFYERSDIDLAVEGLPADQYLTAWALLDGSEPAFTFDLVTPETVRPAIWASVEREGIDL